MKKLNRTYEQWLQSMVDSEEGGFAVNPLFKEIVEDIGTLTKDRDEGASPSAFKEEGMNRTADDWRAWFDTTGKFLIDDALPSLEQAIEGIETMAGDLASVDAVLARRDALAECPNRIDKILRCIETAKRADALAAQLAYARELLDLVVQCLPVGWDTSENLRDCIFRTEAK